MQAENVLLEPVYSFTIEVPTEQIGRAMADIQKRNGSFSTPVTEGERSILTGTVPASTMGEYQRELAAYSRGQGQLSLSLKGYEPCHNTEEVVAAIGYEPERDTENPASSVFCAHGAGFVVDWWQVPEYAHLESGINLEPEEEGEIPGAGQIPVRGALQNRSGGSSDYITQEEIEEIFRKTYGKSGQDYAPYRYHSRNTGSVVRAGENSAGGASGEEKSGENRYGKDRQGNRKEEAAEEYFLVDGYNIIFAGRN